MAKFVAQKVMVIYGGWCNEREVSISSGTEVIKALKALGHTVVPYDLTQDIEALNHAIKSTQPDVIFIALHGTFGEDGQIQAILNTHQIPYTHSGHQSSKLAFDKVLAKDIFKQQNIPTPPHKIIAANTLNGQDPMPRPYILKPISEGSSVGVFVVQNQDPTPTEKDWKPSWGDKILVEPFIPGRELSVAVLDDKALTCTELRAKSGFYDYAAKFTDGFTTQHIVPADIPADDMQRLFDYTQRAHKALGCRGITRCDFRYDESQNAPEQRIQMLELNTHPGLTPISIAPEQAAHAGTPFPKLVQWMIEDAQWEK